MAWMCVGESADAAVAWLFGAKLKISRLMAI
jgi:hypothetical protein